LHQQRPEAAACPSFAINDESKFPTATPSSAFETGL
jgi:hypothetical protein